MSAGSEASAGAGATSPQASLPASPLLGPLGASPPGSIAGSIHEDEFNWDEGNGWESIPSGRPEQPAGEERHHRRRASMSPLRLIVNQLI